MKFNNIIDYFIMFKNFIYYLVICLFNTHTKVVKRSIINKAPLPYSECIDLKSFDSILYQSIIKAKKAYRQSDCFDLCFQKNVIENCGCYYLQYPKLMDPKPCLTTDELLCASNQRIRFIETNLNKQCI